MLAPTFDLSIGGFASSSGNPVGGPVRITVARDLDVPADALEVWLTTRAEIDLDEDVTLALGHDGEDERVFTGKVARLRPNLSGVHVLALGRMNALLNLRAEGTYEDQSPGTIARDLIGQAGLTGGTVDDGPTLPRFAIDHGSSAFTHLKSLADRLGFELYTNRHGEVMFHALGELDIGGVLDAAAGAASDLLGGGGEQFQFGQHLLAAEATRRPSAWERIDVGGESPASSLGEQAAHWLTVEDEDFRGSTGSGERVVTLLDPAARTKDLADLFAAGRKTVVDRVAHQVRFRVLGRSETDLGDTLSIGDALDALLNGTGYVRAIHHRFGPDLGYLTDFTLSLSEAP